MCFTCYRLERIYKTESRTLASVKLEVAQYAFVKVRDLAKRKCNALDIKKCCRICGYSTYVELAHIRPIHTFDEFATLDEVNHLDNLAYLCPNHHKELDNGIISWRVGLEIVPAGSHTPNQVGASPAPATIPMKPSFVDYLKRESAIISLIQFLFKLKVSTKEVDQYEVNLYLKKYYDVLDKR
jgi:hypothetical protein